MVLVARTIPHAILKILKKELMFLHSTVEKSKNSQQRSKHHLSKKKV